MKPMNKLTKRQEETLYWIKTFIRRNEFAPTIREIGKGLGIKSSSVFHLLQTLKLKNYLTYHPNKSRTIKILNGRIQKKGIQND